MKNSGKNIFVFVVCGPDEHIQTLNFSIKYLSRFSKNEIIVVTDINRNKIDIEHDNILDISTPAEFDHHQASIYIKVSLHNILDPGNNYCYLDTDVIAVNEKVDEIFKFSKSPVTFASDHCSLRQFSPNAMNCGCREKRANNIELLNKLELEYDELEREYFMLEQEYTEKYVPKDPEVFKKHEQLQKIITEYCKQYKWFLKMPPFIKFMMAHLYPKKYNYEYYLAQRGDFIWSHKEKKIFDSKNNFIFDAMARHPQYPSYYKHIKGNSNFTWSDVNNFWVDENGNDIHATARCDHLKEAIGRKFKVKITGNDWLHWNGGVFLFNRSSVEFMNTWYNYSMEIFRDNNWKTRDQGTLIATVWKFGLQDQQRLPAEFNLLADFNNTNLKFRKDRGISFNNFNTTINPSLIHVYHNFGKKGWSLWDHIEGLLTEKQEYNLINHAVIKNNEENKIVHGLWIGSSLSQIELLTIHSFLSHGHDFYLWVYDEIKTELPAGTVLKDANSIIPAERVFRYKYSNQFGHGKGSVAGFSDVFRYKLLYEQGGWWVDMDVSCLKPFDFSEPYIFRTHHFLPAVGNIMKCPKGSRLMQICYEQASNSIDELNRDWHKPLTILNENIEELNLSKYIMDISNQDNWNHIIRLIAGKSKASEDWYAIHWANENWRMHNLSKNCFRKNSTLGELMSKHGLSGNNIPWIAKIKNEAKLTWMYARHKAISGVF